MEFKRVTDINDFEAYYLMKCQKDAVLWSGFTSAPDRDRLLEHFSKNIISNPDMYVFYLMDKGDVIGYVQGTRVSKDVVEFSATNIFKKYQGLGYMQDMTQYFFEQMKKIGYSSVIGMVSEHNKPAEYNFEFNNFIKTEEFDERDMPLFGKKHRFYKWIKQL